ncbi:MAG: citramalate synthase [Kangiellaceae bacterium]|nr:citramalate synthase [Kangiellaceae bacterium]
MTNTIRVYDTTLRDGSQTNGISFSLADKIAICKLLDDFQVDYIEAGWPGSNPKDMALFEQANEIGLSHSKLVAFGSTKRPNNKVEEDPQIRQLIEANTSTITIVAKFWDFHVTDILRTSLEQNLVMIKESISHLKSYNKEVFVDAEHFFDGFLSNPRYSYQCILAAVEAGADNITLCDTNGGSTPAQIQNAVEQIKIQFPDLSLGIHCHNDCDLAVANSLSAIESGVDLLQGTVNGYGERCGNANLIPLIANLTFKNNTQFKQDFDLKKLSKLAHAIANIANIPLNANAPYVGENAFTHKGGLHVSAIAKYSKSYEHIDPLLVGNDRTITISELSGRSNLKLQAKELGFNINDISYELLEQVKEQEQQGLVLENAGGTFEMLIRKKQSDYKSPFDLKKIQVQTGNFIENTEFCTAIVKNEVNHISYLAACESKGPVDALDKAIKKTLVAQYPQINEFELVDYKVSIVDPINATAAKTRVWIQASAFGKTWSTIGCSDNILKASAEALADSYQLFILKFNLKREESSHGKNFSA